MARGVDLSKLPRGGMPPPEPEVQWQVTQQEIYPGVNYSFALQEQGVLLIFELMTGLGAIKRITFPFDRLAFAGFLTKGQNLLGAVDAAAEEVTDGKEPESGADGEAGG